MKAITTRFLGPTAMKAPRVTASDEDGNRVTIPYQSELEPQRAHSIAAMALCEKMKWPTALVSGSIKGGYVFVFTS